MSGLLDNLQTAQYLAGRMDAHPDLNDQQRVFVHHIARTSQRLADLIAPIPDTPLAHATLLSRIAPELLEPLASVYGYARLLIDQPQSFGGAHLPPELVVDAETIFTIGRQLAHELEHLPMATRQARAQARNAPMTQVDMVEELRLVLPIWRYEIRETGAMLDLTTPDTAVPILTRIYHLRECLRHLVVTIASELHSQRMRLSLAQTSQDLTLDLHCDPLHLDDEALYTLFQHQGRAIFRQQLKHIHAQLTWRVSADATTHLQMTLPRYTN